MILLLSHNIILSYLTVGFLFAKGMRSQFEEWRRKRRGRKTTTTATDTTKAIENRWIDEREKQTKTRKAFYLMSFFSREYHWHFTVWVRVCVSIHICYRCCEILLYEKISDDLPLIYAFASFTRIELMLALLHTPKKIETIFFHSSSTFDSRWMYFSVPLEFSCCFCEYVCESVWFMQCN